MTDSGQINRLGRDGLHAYLDDGAFFGLGVPLLKRDTHGRWKPRSQDELERVFEVGLGVAIDLSWRMVKLAAVARALNAGDRSMAAIALVQAELPSLRDGDSARRMAQIDFIAKAYDPREPRDANGQWTDGGLQMAQADTGIMTDATLANPQREITPTVLRGFGATYLDSEFATRVDAFDRYAQEAGVTLHYTSAYRDSQTQSDLHNDPTAITPAQQSLHSAGLAVDIKWPSGISEQKAVLAAAQRAGLSWGGNFRNPDPVHFYYDPHGDRSKLIVDFSERVARSRRSGWDR